MLSRAPSPHTRTPRPATVWPCAQDGLREGIGLLVGWLLTAVVKAVTAYTEPGQRVLLLAPAPFLAPSATPGRGQAESGPYAGLHDSVWTIVRLGRGVQTHTAVAPVTAVDGQRTGASIESEIGLRTRTSSPDSDRYDLLLTAAEPHTLDWFRPADWADLLAPTGVLAVITRGARCGGRYVDPAGQLVRDAHDAGLRYLDRIALLRVPAAAMASDQPRIEPMGPIQHDQVHDDLLVFGRSR